MAVFSKTLSKDISVNGIFKLYELYMPLSGQVQPRVGGFAETGTAQCTISRSYDN